MKKITILFLAAFVVATVSAGALKVDAVINEKISVDGMDDEWAGRLCCEGEGELGFGFSTDEDGMLNIAVYPRTETLKRKAGMKGMRVTLYDPKDDENKITVEFKGMGGDDTEKFDGMTRMESRTGYFENGNGSAEMSLSRDKCFAEISVPVSALPLNKSKIMLKVAMDGFTRNDMKAMNENMPSGGRPSGGEGSMGGSRPAGGRGDMGPMAGGSDEMSKDYEMLFEIKIK